MERVSYSTDGGIARITVDDGKVNAMSAATLREIHAAFDRAEKDQRAVVLAGRPKVFSAGFDLKVFSRADPAEVRDMVKQGCDLALRVFSFPLPVVAACTGHAYPMGAFLILGADVRVGIDGPYQIGLNEVLIKLAPPRFGIELARSRLAPAYFNRIVTGEMLSHVEGVTAGYLDKVVAEGELLAAAEQIAVSLSKVDFAAYAETKRRLRATAIDAVEQAIRADLAGHGM